MSPDSSLLLHPAYYCLANAAMSILIIHRRGSGRPCGMMPP